MLPSFWVISGIAGSKYSSTYFDLHQICFATYNYYAQSKYAVNLIRGFQLPMQEVNTSADAWTSIDWLQEEEICLFLSSSHTS